MTSSQKNNEIVRPPVVERLRIAVREKPVSEEDLPRVQVHLKTDEEKIVAYSPNSSEGLLYDYDYFYPPTATQNDLFQTIGAELISLSMRGLSTNCVTLGLAGTGKTHTLFGSQNESGLIQQTVRELIRELDAQSDTQVYHVMFSYWDMDRDRVIDNLLDISVPQDTRNHSIFRDSFGRLYVSNISQVVINSYAEFENALNRGNIHRVERGYQRSARWHGFVQLLITTTDKAYGENCVVRTMTFVHVKGPDRVGEKGIEGNALVEGRRINVSVSLLCAGTIHSLEYREKRRRNVKTKKDLHSLIQKSESFFMECKFSQILSQLLCGHEACIMVGCVDPFSYNETISTLENLQLFRQLTCAAAPMITTSEKGHLLRKLRQLEKSYEENRLTAENVEGRPLTEEEEQLLVLRGKVEGFLIHDPHKETEERMEELKKLARTRLAASSGQENAAKHGTHGDRKKIYLNPEKTATYEGQWADGLFDGFGVHIQANFKYEGEFRRGKREGEGRLFVRKDANSPYKRVYAGEWLEGKRDGKGMQWYSNGDVYKGMFSSNVRHGHGVLYYANGDILEGQFGDDKPDGWGVLKCTNGDWYEGYWCEGMREGPGIWHYVKRQQLLRGEWSKNVSKFGVIEDEPDRVVDENSSFIPAVSLLHYEQILEKERQKLNEKRKREFASRGKRWVNHASLDEVENTEAIYYDDECTQEEDFDDQLSEHGMSIE